MGCRLRVKISSICSIFHGLERRESVRNTDTISLTLMGCAFGEAINCGTTERRNEGSWLSEIRETFNVIQDDISTFRLPIAIIRGMAHISSFIAQIFANVFTGKHREKVQKTKQKNSFKFH